MVTEVAKWVNEYVDTRFATRYHKFWGGVGWRGGGREGRFG